MSNSVVPEVPLRLPAHDGAGIYCRWREVQGAPVAILMHGSDDSMYAAMHTNFSRRLPGEGLSCLRFNSYDFADDARKKHSIGLQEHLDDLSTVVEVGPIEVGRCFRSRS